MFTDEDPPFPTPQLIYQINIHAYSARELPSRPDSNYFLRIHLSGSKTKATTRCIRNTSDPIWDESLEVLPGYYVASDLLKIEIFDKISTDESQKDIRIALFERPVRQFKLGYTIDEDFQLSKCENGKFNKEFTSHGGFTRLKLHFTWRGEPAFRDVPWTWPFYTAEVEFIGLTDCPSGDLKKSDPYLAIKVQPATNLQKVHTKTCKDTLKPIWNESWKFLLSQYEEAALHIVLLDKDEIGEDDELSSLILPIQDFIVGADITERDFPMKPTQRNNKGGILKVRVKISCDNPTDIAGLITAANQHIQATSTSPILSPDPPLVVIDDGSIGDVNEEGFSFKWVSYSSHYIGCSTQP
jgi:hypothetical protein